MDQKTVAFARSWARRYVRTKHPYGLDEGDVQNRILESLYKYSRGKMCGRDGARPSRVALLREGRAPLLGHPLRGRPLAGGYPSRPRASLPQGLRGDKAGGPRSRAAVMERADAQERVPPAWPCASQGGRAGARPSRVLHGGETFGIITQNLYKACSYGSCGHEKRRQKRC